eukprot:GHVS01000725.1.p1 GENE.GHVS01000725.1~~GHVS01000725.1.p1  ORF type:complete len:101 (+),score=10.21 GHVS01000725.1:812-1114(+)
MSVAALPHHREPPSSPDISDPALPGNRWRGQKSLQIICIGSPITQGGAVQRANHYIIDQHSTQRRYRRIAGPERATLLVHQQIIKQPTLTASCDTTTQDK